MTNRWIQDARYAIRQLRRAPGFAAIVILTLAVGIGASAAVFSVVDAALLRPLPFNHQERLVFPDTHAPAGYDQPWSYLSYEDARRQLKTFDAFAAYSAFETVNLEGASGAISLPAVKGSDNFFDVFGVKPLLGRTFLPGEDQPGRDDVSVLSYEVWQTQFGGAKDVIGKVVRLDGTPYTVIGVMPSGFRFPLSSRNAIYTPLHADPGWKASRGTHWMETVGRMKEGVSREQTQAEFVRVLADLGRAYPDTDLGRTVKIVPLNTQVAGKVDGPLRTLVFAVMTLLAIACVNVAGLLLARGVKREREVALRAAIGAGRGRLVQQLITESLVLSLAGLAGGLVLSWAVLAAMRRFLVEAIARGTDVHMDWRVVAVAALLSIGTSVAASLVPAVRLSGIDPNRALRAGGNAGTGLGQHRTRSLFVVTQVGLSLLLLVVSGLLLRNLRDMMRANLGFDPKPILSVQINLSPGRYEGRDPLVAFYQPLLERVSHLPGVQGAGLVNMLPIRQWGSNSDVHITGQPPYAPNQEMLAEVRFVSAGYFDVMGQRLVRGRMLSQALETPDRPAGSIVVNEAFRRKFFTNGGDPVGAHRDSDDDTKKGKTGIVGVVTDVKQNLQAPTLAEMDWLMDEVDPKDRLGLLSNATLVVRSSSDPQMLTEPLRRVFHEIDPTVPFKAPETMENVISDSLVFERMQGWLFGTFAGFALLLAVVGVYGLVQHEVELRTREIGIRMALGSTRGMVMRSVLGRVAVLMIAGAGLGIVLTAAVKRALAAVVVMKTAHDFEIVAAVAAMLIVIGLVVSLAPSWKAATVDPMQALRAE